jgi:hypothetical protein
MNSLIKIISQALVLPADVSIEFCKTCQRGEQLECQLTLKSWGSAIDVEKISIALTAEENVDIDAGYQSGYDPKAGDEMVTIHVGTVTSKTVTVNEIITVSNAINLEPNTEHAWKANFVVPNSCNPTYRGIHAHHTWYLSATITLAHRKLLSRKNFSYRWDRPIVS